MQKKLISLLLVLAMALSIVACGNKSVTPNGEANNSNNENNTGAVDNIKNGTAELAYTSKNKIHRIEHVDAYNYFETTDDNGNTVILDTNSDDILTLNGYYQYIDIERGEGLISLKNNYEYLGDHYFLVNEVINGEYSSKVFDLQKKEAVFTYESGSTLSETLYQNDILYYYDGKADKNTLVAYDLVNAKELWRYSKLSCDNYSTCIFGNYIFLDSDNYSSRPDVNDRVVYPSVVLDVNGNVVIEGNTDKIEHSYRLDMYDLVHTFFMNDNYYLKVKFKDYIEVYDFNNKLISTISLEPDENHKYRFLLP